MWNSKEWKNNSLLNKKSDSFWAVVLYQDVIQYCASEFYICSIFENNCFCKDSYIFQGPKRIYAVNISVLGTEFVKHKRQKSLRISFKINSQLLTHGPGGFIIRDLARFSKIVCQWPLQSHIWVPVPYYTSKDLNFMWPESVSKLNLSWKMFCINWPAHMPISSIFHF